MPPNWSTITPDAGLVLPFIAYCYAAACEHTDTSNTALGEPSSILTCPRRWLMIPIRFSEPARDILNHYSVMVEVAGTGFDEVSRLIRQHVKAIWFPILQQIQYFARRNPGLLAFHTRYWKRFATSVGLNPETLEAEGLRDLPSRSTTAYCRWKGCICFVKKPLHKLRVCTGCGKARYCNSHCQTLWVVVGFCDNLMRLTERY